MATGTSCSTVPFRRYTYRCALRSFQTKSHPKVKTNKGRNASRRVSEQTSAISCDGTKQEGSIFVAGSTGKVGYRVVRELIRNGYHVRAGTRNTERTKEWMSYENVPTKLCYTGESMDKRKEWDALDMKDVEIVRFDLDVADTLEEAIGDAKIVVCCLGAPESEIFDFQAPKRIDGEGTILLIRAAKRRGVERFVLVSSLGVGKFGMPASLLNAWGSVLDWKKKAEDELRESGMEYTIIRPGGMERPTDDFGDDTEYVLSKADTKFGGLVSNLQVAQLIGEVVSAPTASKNKTVEVIAEKGVPKRDLIALLEDIAADEIKGAEEGTASFYQEKYKYDPSKEGLAGKLLDLDTQLETYMGRLAMLGILAGLGAQAFGRGKIVADQWENTGVEFFVIVLSLLIAIASAIPWMRDITREDAQLPPFVPVAETWNGRWAMFAFAVVVMAEFHWNVPILEHLQGKW